jgi:hypothetical protein
MQIYFLLVFPILKYILKRFLVIRAKHADHYLPVCRNNLLDKSNRHYEKLDGTFSNSFEIISLTPYRQKCRLLNYTIRKVVTCFDYLYQEHTSMNSLHQTNNTSEDPLVLNFVFIGDSRIRQQYYNFLQVKNV